MFKHVNVNIWVDYCFVFSYGVFGIGVFGIDV